MQITIVYFLVAMLSLSSCNTANKKQKGPNSNDVGAVGGYCEYTYDTTYYKIAKIYPHNEIYNMDLINLNGSKEIITYLALATFNQPRKIIDSAIVKKIKVRDSLTVIYGQIVKGSCNPNSIVMKFPFDR